MPTALAGYDPTTGLGLTDTFDPQLLMEVFLRFAEAVFLPVALEGVHELGAAYFVQGKSRGSSPQTNPHTKPRSHKEPRCGPPSCLCAFV